MNGNYIDLIIIIVLLYFIFEGIRHGFLVMMSDFLSFFLSLLISLRLYQMLSGVLKSQFNLIDSISKSLAFIISAVILESILGLVFGYLLSKLPKKILKAKINKLLAVIPALGEGLVITAFILTLGLSFPLPSKVKKDINSSLISSHLINQTQGVERIMKQVFGGVIEDSLTYLTIDPQTTKKLDLEFPVTRLSEDPQAEIQMFELVNEERRKNGIGLLAWDNRIVIVARNYAKDMWERKYFGHISPEGEDVGDRLERSGIEYFLAGENLALAPTTQTAHTGLMNSEGHKRNIMDSNFESVAIGVIDNGIYGKIFVQIFIK